MGALAGNRKRGGDEYFNSNFNHKKKSPYPISIDFQFFKKPKFSLNQSPEKAILPHNSTVSRISRYPEPKIPFPRAVHAPVRHLKFGLPEFVGYVFIKEISDVQDLEVYKKLLESAERRNSKLKELDFQIELNEKCKAGLEALRPEKEPEEEQVEVLPPEPFIPITEEEMTMVSRAFSVKNWRKILVSHQNSSIDIRGEVLQCLKPGAWVNDEVINLYLELLKERENRDPKKFLKCHFFNTFFYKKEFSWFNVQCSRTLRCSFVQVSVTIIFFATFALLNYVAQLVNPESGYNYKAVKRWTSQRKLGYCLLECDKIFVPINKEIHWCLAVINKKDQKFQYLDSLKGKDPNVMRALAKYLVEEVKDKSGKNIDISSWEQEYVEDLPAQENGFDCGMFMLKYIDFYSRGLRLCFNQEHMPYFRLRTAKEILNLRAD
ncbi:EARLY IN SHORT DAYS 4 [Hibiscus trionum]|uniref:EARLY IN SHORT DAYS 4 n=1 Tax=Hibiscus trionum TaxID=183268 RepID=A0A9W7LWZ4_HIBTR|nr:EARLY IN SHORT DAYS 4 [Hibiscus trionum]